MRLVFVFLTFAVHVTFAQNDSTKRVSAEEPLHVKKNLTYYFGHIKMKHVEKSNKFDLQIDTRNSFVNDFPINLYGVNVGLIHRERLRYGVGYYWLNQNFNNRLLGIYTASDAPHPAGRVIVTAKGIPIPVATLQKLVNAGKLNSFITAAQKVDFWFASAGFMYSFYVSRLVEFAIPIELGYGNFSENLYDVSGNDFSSLGATLHPGVTSGNFIPGQIGFDVLLKPQRWVFFEGSMGFRQMLVQNYTSKYRATSFDSQFNGEYYNIGVKIQLGTILSDWKEWKKKKAAKKAESPNK